jgi:O-methyltransferase
MCEMAAATPEGCFVEVGVYKGGTAYELNEVAKRQGRTLYLYDTFTGIPSKHSFDTHNCGDFSDTSLREVQDAIPEAIIYPGVFPLTARDMGPIAFVHLDCDQYMSYKEAIRYLSADMVPGGVMWFDDCPALVGAAKACEEAFGDRIIYGEHGKSFVRF